MTDRFDLDHNLDLWILKVKRDLDLWPHTWPWPWIFMVKFWYSCISEWEGRLTLHKGGGSRSFMTMTMTIWWPRSGVWIYQIVTGVTSVVGVPSTLLVSSKGVEKLLSKLNVKKASGPDNISCHILRELSAELAPVLAGIFTQSIESGEVPQDWTQALHGHPDLQKG